MEAQKVTIRPSSSCVVSNAAAQRAGAWLKIVPLVRRSVLKLLLTTFWFYSGYRFLSTGQNHFNTKRGERELLVPTSVEGVLIDHRYLPIMKSACILQPN